MQNINLAVVTILVIALLIFSVRAGYKNDVSFVIWWLIVPSISIAGFALGAILKFWVEKI